MAWKRRRHGTLKPERPQGVVVSGIGVWDTYNTVDGVHKLVPVDVYVTGCPPPPWALLQGLWMVQEMATGRLPSGQTVIGREPVAGSLSPAWTRYGDRHANGYTGGHTDRPGVDTWREGRPGQHLVAYVIEADCDHCRITFVPEHHLAPAGGQPHA